MFHEALKANLFMLIKLPGRGAANLVPHPILGASVHVVVVVLHAGPLLRVQVDDLGAPDGEDGDLAEAGVVKELLLGQVVAADGRGGDEVVLVVDVGQVGHVRLVVEGEAVADQDGGGEGNLTLNSEAATNCKAKIYNILTSRLFIFKHP